MDETIRGKNNAFFRQLLFLVVLAGLAILIFSELKFFVGSFLGAITIYVVIRKVMFRMVEKLQMYKWLAALLLVIVAGAALAGFFWVLVRAIGSEIPHFNLRQTLTSINDFFASLNSNVGMNIIPDNIVRESDGLIAKGISGILSTTYSFAVNMLMMLIVLYFMLASGRRMESTIWKYAPLREESLCMIRQEVTTMIHSNAVGIPIILVAQTLVSTLIYWLLGFEGYWFWGFLTAICGLLPLFGTAFVYVPVAIYLAATGSLLYAVILLLYGFLIIANIDNLFRIILLHKVADTHPLIVIFGVILGVPLFGFWGIIFGPLLISGFILLIRIYYIEYGFITPPPGQDICSRPNKIGPRFFKNMAPKGRSAKQSVIKAKDNAVDSPAER